MLYNIAYICILYVLCMYILMYHISYPLPNEGNSFYEVSHLQFCMHLTYAQNYDITKQHNQRAVYS